MFDKVICIIWIKKATIDIIATGKIQPSPGFLENLTIKIGNSDRQNMYSGSINLEWSSAYCSF